MEKEQKILNLCMQRLNGIPRNKWENREGHHEIKKEEFHFWCLNIIWGGKRPDMTLDALIELVLWKWTLYRINQHVEVLEFALTGEQGKLGPVSNIHLSQVEF